MGPGRFCMKKNVRYEEAFDFFLYDVYNNQ